jgi:NAD(P)-dependent dehydrogenase (short-subunit alcohol dehydrogenase family)
VSVGAIDAVVCCAASVPLTPLVSLPHTALANLFKGKLLGQLHLVHVALDVLRNNRLDHTYQRRFDEPILGSAPGALVNSGLESFVRAAAPEPTRGLRLNIVSPGWVRETLVKPQMKIDGGTAVSTVADTYVKAVEGTANGEVLRPG